MSYVVKEEAPKQSYQVHFRHSPTQPFGRSNNYSKTISGKSLGTYEFSTYEEAKKEAELQQEFMGGSYEYKAVPEVETEQEIIDRIKKILDTPAPPTKLEQIKAILEGI